MPRNDTAKQLKAACAGLDYPSETDAPWRVFRWSSAAGAPTVEGVKRRGRRPTNEPASEQSLEAFFKPLTCERDWYRDEERSVATRYRALQDLLAKHLAGLRVFRFGTSDVRIFVVGQDTAGGWTGVKTRAVET